MMKTIHYPVMYREVIKELSLRNKKIIVDCTIGVASHALKFFEVMDKNSILIGIDKDDESLRVARTRLRKYESRFELFKDDFRNLDLILDNLGIKKADVFFFDLGISTFQLSDSQRGFSFSKDGPLDMRMDKRSFLCAYDIVNYLSEYELNAIFKKFGEERFSRRIAHLVVEKRRQEPISTTSQLKDVVLEAVPRRHYSFRHPATRIFQALRIVVNRELESLEMGIKKAVERLSRGGKIGVITFHSLEDRIVKHTFRDLSLEGAIKLVNKKPFIPKTEELEENISSRSAKLRVAEKIV